MKRIVDLSFPISPSPGPAPQMPPPPPTHTEPVSSAHTRADFMGLLALEPFHLGDSLDEIMMQVTCTVDPVPGTHIEIYYSERWYYEDVPGRRLYVHDVGQLRASQLAHEAAIVDIPADTLGEDLAIDERHLEKSAGHVQEDDIVFIRTGWSKRYAGKTPTQDAYRRKPGLTLPAAQWLVDRKIGLYGIDGRGMEAPSALPSGRLLVHEKFCLNNIYFIEDLAGLEQITQKRVFVVVGTPMKMRHLTGAPCRVVAIEQTPGSGYKVYDLNHVMQPYPKPAPPRPEVDPGAYRRSEPIRQKAAICKRLHILPFQPIAKERAQDSPGGWENGIDDVIGPEYIRFNSHIGTHLEAPFYGRDIPPAIRKDVSQISLDRLVGDAYLINLPHIGPEQVISADDLKGASEGLRAGDIAVIRTGYSDWYYHTPDYLDLTPGLSEEAAKWLVEKKVRTVVTDCASIEAQKPSQGSLPSGRAKNMLFQHDIPVVECACNMWLIKKPRFMIACLPLRIVGLDASPAHVIVMEDW